MDEDIDIPPVIRRAAIVGAACADGVTPRPEGLAIDGRNA